MKKLFSLFVAVLFASSVFAAATVVTFTKADFAGQGTANTGSEVSATKSGVTFTYSKGYCADESLRCYAHGALSITATVKITKINFTTTGGKTGGLASEVTVNATSYTIADLASQARFTEVAVTLDGEGGGEGGEGTYEYDENSDFNGTFATYTIDDTYLQEYGSIYVEAQDDNNNYIILDITLPENASGLVAGTYNVVVVENDEYPFQSVTAGFYYDDEEEGGVYPSYAAVLSADGQSLENIWYIVSGTVVVDENLAITVNAKNSLGKNVKAVIAEAGEGGGGEEDETYTGDEQEANFDVNFAKYTIDDIYLQEYGSIYVEAQDDNNNYIILDITLPENATGLVAGTYNVVVVDEEYPYQSVTAGYYYDDEDYVGPEPSYAAVISADGESLQNVWYIVSGTVVVDENRAITVNAKNSLGRNVKTVLAEEDEPETAVENANDAVKALKTLENGMIIIERNGVRHNVIGQVVR